MTIALWIVNILLAAAFLGAGGMKSVRSRSALQNAGMAWTETFTDSSVKLIGIAEVVGAAGLILPLLFPGFLRVVAPVAALCLAALMLGAVMTHRRRRENGTPSLVLLVLSLVSTVLGLIHAFS